MFKLNQSLVSFIVIVIFSFLTNISVFSEEYPGIKKIILGKFKSKDGEIIGLPKDAPYWKEVDRTYIAIDDSDNIYVLNWRNSEILIYTDMGKQIGKVKIKHELRSPGSLEVSGDSKRFFLIQGLKGYVINRNGEIIRSAEEFYGADLTRRCDGNYVDHYGQNLYDQNLNHIRGTRHKILRKTDGKRDYYICGRENLEKYSSSGKIIWKKPLSGCRGIVGIDGENNIYLEIEAGPGGRGDWKFIKMDKDGKVIKTIPIPDYVLHPVPFDERDKEEWETYASEEPFEWDKLTCKGNIYRIYSFWQLPKGALQRWLKGGEYFIYKFEMAGD